jgi:hypothetical protein
MSAREWRRRRSSLEAMIAFGFLFVLAFLSDVAVAYSPPYFGAPSPDEIPIVPPRVPEVDRPVSSGKHEFVSRA